MSALKWKGAFSFEYKNHNHNFVLIYSHSKEGLLSDPWTRQDFVEPCQPIFIHLCYFSSIEWVIYEGRRAGGVGIKVCEHVQLCIDDSIIDKDVMPTIREKLQKFYLIKSLTNQLHMKQLLYKLKMEEGEHLIEHSNVLNVYWIIYKISYLSPWFV